MTSPHQPIQSNFSKSQLKKAGIFIQSFFFGIIKETTPREAKIYAENNKVVDPRPYIYSLPEDIKRKVRDVITKNPNLLETWIQSDKVLSRLAKKRQKLAKVLSQYPKWFNNYLEIIKKVLSGI